MSALAPGQEKIPETAVKLLYDSLNDQQRKVVCFDWEYVDPNAGCCGRASPNNWRITPPAIHSDFFTPEQQRHDPRHLRGHDPARLARQVRQATQGRRGRLGHRAEHCHLRPARAQGKFEFVLTGRHMTLRCDGHSAEHVAFGGPIFYGHAASGFNEKPDHPGNIFWPQALAANDVFRMLDGKQQKEALLDRAPEKATWRSQGPRASSPASRSRNSRADQKEHLQQVLAEADRALSAVGPRRRAGVPQEAGRAGPLSLAFYRQDDLGNDRVWDIWRLEGPAFVWHFRGAPHVHVWVNVADDPSVKLNA